MYPGTNDARIGTIDVWKLLYNYDWGAGGLFAKTSYGDDQTKSHRHSYWTNYESYGLSVTIPSREMQVVT